MSDNPADFGQSQWEKSASQVVRYEALMQLLDDMLVEDDILMVAKLVAKKWKYFSNVASWHLALVNAEGFLLMDGFHATATLSQSTELPAWDQQYWQNPRPIPLLLADMGADVSAPPHLTGQGVHEVLVLPIVFKEKFAGMISVSTRHLPFNETDRRFIQLFSHQFAARIQHLALKNKMIETLTSQATHDSLTGLLNRGSIMEHLHSKLALSQRSGQPLAIIMADIDFFKHINDTYGHRAGDEVLEEIPHRMQLSSRHSDSFGRYGGEEFLFVLFPCTREEAATAAERFRRSVSELPFTIHTHGTQEIQVTISAGCACTVDQADVSADTLLKQADAALYEAKAKGRNRVEVAP